MIDVLIERFGGKGYKYQRGYINIDKIPDSVRPKSLYVNISSMGESADQEGYSLRSSSVLKPQRNRVVFNFVDDIRQLDHDEYIKSMRELITSALELNKTEHPEIVLIEITGSRVVETEGYIVFSVNIQWTEV